MVLKVTVYKQGTSLEKQGMCYERQYCLRISDSAGYLL